LCGAGTRSATDRTVKAVGELYGPFCMMKL
jgi:hypothetical protein